MKNVLKIPLSSTRSLFNFEVDSIFKFSSLVFRSITLFSISKFSFSVNFFNKSGFTSFISVKSSNTDEFETIFFIIADVLITSALFFIKNKRFVYKKKYQQKKLYLYRLFLGLCVMYVYQRLLLK
jgi:hypothetical protein